MEYLIFTLIMILISYITYKIIKNKSTTYKYTTLEILKDTKNPLIKNKIVSKELKCYDYVYLCKKERFVFGKLKFSELYISKGCYGNCDFDDCDDW